MSDRIIEIHTGPAGPPGPAGPTTWAGITDKPPVFKPDVTDPALTATYGAPAGAGVSRFIARANAGATLKIVGLGDSITAGTGATLGVDDYLTLVTNGLAARFPTATITQSNRASSGATTAMSAIRGNLTDAINDQGDLYVLGFGRNDITVDDAGWGGQPVQGYKRERSLRYYEVMLRTIRARAPQADILIVTENPSATYAADTNMRTYQAGVRELARAYGAELADTYAAYADAGDYSSLLSDAVHPSVAGHAVYAATVLDRIPAAPLPIARGTAAATLAKGMRDPETVDTTIGTYGWTILNASDPTPAYAQTGAGWNSAYPRETSGVGDYMEVTFTGTDFGIRVDHTSAAAPVVDISVDGTPVYTNQSLHLVAGPSQLYQFLATDLADGQHTIRITLVSGTLRWYQAAWLAGAPLPATGVVGGLRKMTPTHWYTQQRTRAASISFPTAGDVYVVPLWVPAATTFTHVGLSCTTGAASSTVTLGIYSSDEYDQPDTLIYSSAAQDTSTIGWKQDAFTGTLQPGWYWLAALTLGGAPRYQGNDLSHPLVTSSSGTVANAVNAYIHAGQSSLPVSWSSTVAATLAPLVALKAA